MSVEKTPAMYWFKVQINCCLIIIEQKNDKVPDENSTQNHQGVESPHVSLSLPEATYKCIQYIQ